MNGTIQVSLEEKIKESIVKLAQLKKLNEIDSKDLLDYYLTLQKNPNYTEEAILEELYRMFTETNFVSQKLSDIRSLKAYSVGSMNGENVNMNSFDIPSYSINNMQDFEIDIIDVDDGEESEFTGVIPVNVNFDDYSESQEVSEGQSKGKQKTLNAHPGIHWGEDSGFMTFLLVIFLAGISSGIIFMIILNFLSK